MDEVGIELSVVFTNACGAEFDRQTELFGANPKRFQLWYSFDARTRTRPASQPDWLRNWNVSTRKAPAAWVR